MFTHRSIAYINVTRYRITFESKSEMYYQTCFNVVFEANVNMSIILHRWFRFGTLDTCFSLMYTYFLIRYSIRTRYMFFILGTSCDFAKISNCPLGMSTKKRGLVLSPPPQ